MPYEPVRCKACAACLNPYAQIDFNSKLFVCPFCHARNNFPPHYAGITEQNLPAELFPNYLVIDYTINPNKVTPPPAYLFLVDVCVSDEELASLKASLTQALSLLPEDSLVGLISFGTHVHVHELQFADCPKSYVFRGGKEHTSAQIRDQLTFSRGGGGPQQQQYQSQNQNPNTQQQQQQQQQPYQQTNPASSFLVPLSECEFTFSAILEELARDPFAPLPQSRHNRATGTALAVASTLLSLGCPSGHPARACLFVGGPCTEGPGNIVPKALENATRSHKDIAQDKAPLFTKAKKKYDAIATQLCANGHSLDVFACALDQVGLAEMKGCAQKTGGAVVLAESFSHVVFKKSFVKLYGSQNKPEPRPESVSSSSDEVTPLKVHSNGIFEVITSRDVKVAGCVGPCAALDTARRHLGNVADVSIGYGGTTAWKMCALTRNTTLAVFFEVAKEKPDGASGGGYGQNPYGQQQQYQSAPQFFLQFHCTSTLPTGETRLRVITTTRRWTNGQNIPEISMGFDQEAAAVLIARQLTWKMEQDDEMDGPAATRWLDRKLIGACQRFGEYRKEDPHSFQLAPQFSLFPQFMFNLRRSQFVQVFNNSPDETAYFRVVLWRENVLNSLVMIQPTLTAYSFNGPPEPVLLDVCSVAPDRILLLDAYFSVVVFHGSTIAQWRKAKYQEQEEHKAFAELLKMPQEDANYILNQRFPVPRLVDCDQNGSQARFLLAKLNPSATHNSQGSPYGHAGGSDVIFTDDVSLQVFMEHLKRLSVSA